MINIIVIVMIIAHKPARLKVLKRSLKIDFCKVNLFENYLKADFFVEITLLQNHFLLAWILRFEKVFALNFIGFVQLLKRK